MRINAEFIKKYDRRGPRYTSYPPATFFTTQYDEKTHREQLILSNENQKSNISIYIHIPFCPVRCSYCGCTQEGMQGRNYVREYVDAVLLEIERVAGYLDKNRLVTQVHWGGGTPNAIHLDFIEEIMNALRKNFTFPKEEKHTAENLVNPLEIAMEIDPSLISVEKLERLRKMGFNRVSFGVQDFDEKVLEIVNRKASRIPIPELVSVCREIGFKGINLDFIYGLPKQTRESFQKTIQKAVHSNPDRIVTFSYAHVPWFKPYQKELENYSIPTSDEKLDMFLDSLDQITKAGYTVIGMDHYAKPDDELSLALRNKQLHRNFQGYASKFTTGQVYAFGCSSISQLETSYGQNVKSSGEYVKRIMANEFAIEKGYVLSKEQRKRRFMINEIMCNGELSLSQVSENFSIEKEDLLEELGTSLEKCQEFVDDGLLEISQPLETIRVTKKGWLTVRSIAMAFDPMLEEKTERYSKTL